jgi:hypothetical protein
MYLKEIERKGVERIHLAQDKNKLQDLDNAVVELSVPEKAENSSTS